MKVERLYVKGKINVSIIKRIKILKIEEEKIKALRGKLRQCVDMFLFLFLANLR